MIETVKLGDVATVKGGKRLPKGTNLITTPNSHPYIRVRVLNNQSTLELNDDFEYVDDETQKSISRYIVEAGDIVLSIVGTIGLVAIIGESLHKANLTENCVKLTQLDGVDRDYLYYFLKSGLGQAEIAKGTVGAVQAKLPIKNIQNIDVILPDIETQKRISSILRSIDDKISTNQKINNNLQQQAQAVFAAWLATHASIADEVTLGGICLKVTDGSHFSPKDESSSKIPMLSVKDMEEFDFNFASCKHISDEDYQKMIANDCVPQVDDILVAKDGSYLKEIFIHNEQRELAILSSIAIFRPDPSKIYPEILLAFLKSPRVLQEVRDNYVSGSALPRIVLKDFKKLRFSLPNIATQEEIAPLLASIRSQIAVNVAENQRLSQLRDALLPKLISGEIDISDIQL